MDSQPTPKLPTNLPGFAFGVPLDDPAHSIYSTAALDKYGGDVLKAIEAQERTLGVVTQRANVLTGSFSLAIAILVILRENRDFPVRLSIDIGLVFFGFALIFVASVLWLNWSRDPNIYLDRGAEFQRTIRLVHRRAARVNFAICVATAGVVTALVPLALYRAGIWQV